MSVAKDLAFYRRTLNLKRKDSILHKKPPKANRQTTQADR